MRSLFEEGDARRVAQGINGALLRDEQRIWVQSATKIMEISDLFDRYLLQQLFDKYVTELKGLPEPPTKAFEAITAIYPRATNQEELATVLNEKFLTWSNAEAGLKVISSLSHSEIGFGENAFPSPEIVSSLLGVFNPLSGDLKVEGLRKDIIFNKWKSEYAEKLYFTFSTVLKVEQSQNAFGDPLRLALRAICEQPDILNGSQDAEIAAFLPSAFSRAKKDEDRELVRDTLSWTAAAGSPNERTASLNTLTSYWSSDSDSRLRRDLQPLLSRSAEAVIRVLISSQTDAVTKELQRPSERTLQRLQLISEFPHLAPENFVDQQYTSALSVSSEEGYAFWESTIISRPDAFGQQMRSEIANRAIDLVSNSGALNQRKPNLLRLAVGMCPDIASEQLTLTRRVLELLWHSDNVIRNAAASVVPLLRIHMNQGDIRIHLNAGIHEHLRTVVLSNFLSFQPVIDVLVAMKDLWNEGSSRSITQLAIALSSDENLKNPAISLLESVNEFDESDLQDVLHVLRTFETTQGVVSERARSLLKRIAPDDPPKASGEGM